MKGRPLVPTVSQVVEHMESSWRKLKMLLQRTHQRKQNSLLADMEEVLVAWEDQTSDHISVSQSLTRSEPLALFDSTKAES